ncbi:DUF2931 family protein [Pedobacter sp. MW01-1-1]|uniref:DUF2931 family protein n=1 Tax=Pedobacter sp. MW01-1-1 TaxID=3383027 RepID=UPI003FEFEBE1
MKVIAHLVLLMGLSIPLASCQNKEKMKTKFNWQETISCPLGYPVDVYRGGLKDANGGYTSLYLGTHSGNEGWGSLGRSMSNGMKTIPNYLHAIWVSYAEKVFYEIDTPIDYDKMIELFSKGYYSPSMNRSKPQPRHENYDTIVVGFAPGGTVVVWISGVGRQIEIGRYQGKKVVIPQEEINALSPGPHKNMFDPEYQHDILYNFGIVPLEVVKANEGKAIPYGIWDTYRKKYNWKLEIQLPDDKKVKKVWKNFYNGEQYDLFGTTLIEEYPTIIPEELKWNTLSLKAIPSYISFSWMLDTKYVGKITFNEQEILKAFEEVYGEDRDTEASLIIYVNLPKTYAAIKLKSKNKEVPLLKNKITVRKTNLTF